MSQQSVEDAYAATVVEEVWAALEPAALRYLAAPRRRERIRRHRRSVGAAVTVVAIGLGGTAAAARLLTGDPAPPAVQRSIAGVDEGMPVDLRLNPDATHARSVAIDGRAVLYAADLPDGGICTEIALADRPMGAVCHIGSVPVRPIEVTIPGTPEDAASLVVVAGRINRDADAATLTTGDGHRIALPLRPGRFFIVELNRSESDAARAGLHVEATLASRPVATLDLTDAFTPENGRLDPIAADMVSAPGDLTQIVSFAGSVQIPGAVTVRLVYPDGSHTDVSIAADRHYTLAVPLDRRSAFARTPGRLLALDARGKEVASRTVAAVSFWQATEGHR